MQADNGSSRLLREIESMVRKEGRGGGNSALSDTVVKEEPMSLKKPIQYIPWL